VAGQVVAAARFEHDAGGERLALAGAVADGVERAGATSASVWVSRSRSSALMVSGWVWRACQAAGVIPCGPSSRPSRYAIVLRRPSTSSSSAVSHLTGSMYAD